MAESSFTFNFAEEVLRKFGSLPYQDMSFACCLERDVDKLEDTLLTIKAVLLDAEEKQKNNLELSDWLGKITDACYDIDNVFDEFQYEASSWQLVKRSSIKTKVCNFFSHSNPLAVHFKIGRVIKETRLKLDELEAEKVQFKLTLRLRGGKIIYSARDTRFYNFSSLSNPLAFHFKLMVDENIEAKNVKSKSKKQVIYGRVGHMERETRSFVQTSDVIGRDFDKQKIIKLLMRPSENDNISIIPIVGLGGLGKSTLAKLVYNDEKVRRHFELKMWVYVSQDFDVRELTKQILCSATTADCSELDLEQMQVRVRSSLRDKFFLLILDDVWRNYFSKWVELRNLLTVGANRSKIIVTTRDQPTANIMGTVSPYILRRLTPHECRSLFVKYAFRDGGEKEYPALLEIGHEIARKCSGVPLAVRILGSLLYSERDKNDWLYVKDNEVWERDDPGDSVSPALRLSFDAMPLYLKQCFAFCSIFPKGYELSSIELIYLWMAHDFLLVSNPNQEPEDIGQQCINELWSRSLFQDFNEVLGGLRGFKMHDIVHVLAQYVAMTHGNFPTRNISFTLQHVSIFEDDSSRKEVLSTLSAQQWKNVRTILYRKDSTSYSLMETYLPRCNHLRVLYLCDSQIDELPNSVGKLKHLRYLSLFRNGRIKKLPNSICKLVNLQTLNLARCKELEELPKDIGNLIRLRCLFLTTKQIVLPEKGIGCLTSLRFLYIGHCDNLKFLDEGMRSLTALRNLIIESCNRLESLPRSMKCLTALETLAIADCGKLNIMELAGDIKGLKFFYLKMVPKLVALPPWLQGTAETLQTIQIEDCPCFKELPKWLEYLTSLQKLVIEDCPLLLSLPEEMVHLTALKELKIKGCPELSRRCNQEGEDWFKISHIHHITLDEIISDKDEDGDGEGEGEGEEEPIGSSVASSDETTITMEKGSMEQDSCSMEKDKSLAIVQYSEPNNVSFDEESASTKCSVVGESLLVKDYSGEFTTYEIHRTRSCGPMQFISFIPEEIREFIKSTHDVQTDGNCGFRVVAAIVKGNEDKFVEVRQDLLSELNGNVELYSNLFESMEQVKEGMEQVKELREILSYFDEGHSAPDTKWMIMPEMGPLIASAYNAAVFHLSKYHCLTFLPLRTAPPPPPVPLKEVGIGFVNKNHFIQVFMKDGNPVPPVTNLWNRFRSDVAAAWEEFYLERGQKFLNVIGKSTATSETFE